MTGHCLMLARFPDGTICFGHYQGTSDVPGSCLHKTLAEAREHRHGWHDEPDVEILEPEVDVDLYALYGGGFHWRGKARGLWLTDCGHRMSEQDFDDSHGIEGQVDGTPVWVPVWYQASCPCGCGASNGAQCWQTSDWDDELVRCPKCGERSPPRYTGERLDLPVCRGCGQGPVVVTGDDQPLPHAQWVRWCRS